MLLIPDATASPGNAGAASAAPRIAALRSTGLLGAPAEERFDRLTRLARRLLRTPVSLVSLLDDERQFFLSAQGLPEPLASLRETPLSHALCRSVVESGLPLVVEDACCDPRMSDIPTVQAFGIRGYLAVPLALPDGCVIGSLCAVDLEPRRWTAGEEQAITDLAGAVMAEFAATLRVRELDATSSALRASEARLRATFEQAAVGIAHVGLDGRWLRVNARLCSILGYAEAELLERTFQDITHPADLESDLVHLRDLLAGESTTCTLEKRYIRKDGAVVWANLTVSLVRDGSGAPQHFISVIEDVAGRRAAEAANAHLAAIVASAPDAIVSFAPEDGRILTWNQGAERLFGYTEREAVGGPVDLLMPADRPDDSPAVVFAWALSGHPVVAHETVRVAKTGEPIPVAITATRMRTPAGRVLGVSSIFHDLRPRIEAETALRESEARLRSILDTVPDAMLAFDEEGRIETFSATAERLFGYAADEAIGRSVATLMASPTRDTACNCLARYVETGKHDVTGRVLQGARKDGSAFPMEIALGETRIGGRRLFTGFARDLTEQRAAETRLQELRAELLHVARLSAAGEMASALAHELNQPLTAAASAARAARRMLILSPGDPAAPAQIAEAIDLAAEQALRGGQIVRRLRDFVGRGGEVDKRLEDLAKLARDAGALALVDARERGVQVGFRFDPYLPPVLVDRVQIQQVLVNLVRNAIEALAPNGAGDGDSLARRQLLVGGERRAPDLVEVVVADTGPGVAPEIRERVFDAFVSTKPGGMGMGLSICRSIVEAHGGRLWVEANQGGGAVFRFTLPAATEAVP